MGERWRISVLQISLGYVRHRHGTLALPLKPTRKIPAGNGSNWMRVGSRTKHVIRIGCHFETVWNATAGEPDFYRVRNLAMDPQYNCASVGNSLPCPLADLSKLRKKPKGAL